MSQAETEPRDLAVLVDEAINQQSRYNEAAIAYVRVGIYALMALMELYWTAEWLAGSADAVPWTHRLPIWLGLPVAAALAIALSRGWYRPALRWISPSLDIVVVGARFAGSLAERSNASIAEHHDMANIMGVMAALIIAGAFRMSWAVTASATGAVLALYAAFALSAGVGGGMLAGQLILLAGVGGLAVAITIRLNSLVKAAVARSMLSRFVSRQVVDAAHSDPVGFVLKPRSLAVTVLVSDLRGFTSWAEERPPVQAFDHLNLIQGTLAQSVVASGGLVDKFLGDGMLAVFGAQDQAGHADQAVRAARRMLQDLHTLNRGLPEADRIDLGIGIHTGQAMLGVLGGGAKLEFTVIGDTVNTAARLQEHTKNVHAAVVVSGQTVAALVERSGLERREPVLLRGRTTPVEVFVMEDRPSENTDSPLTAPRAGPS